jgi:hypothetical protein
MEAVHSSETLLNLYRTILRHIPENSTFQVIRFDKDGKFFIV